MIFGTFSKFFKNSKFYFLVSYRFFVFQRIFIFFEDSEKLEGPLENAFFEVYPSINYLSFVTRFMLGAGGTVKNQGFDYKVRVQDL